MIAIYDVMKVADNFTDTARRLHLLVRNTARSNPGEPRALYFDVDGHLNSEGGFDADAFEIQRHFICGLLAPWLTEIHMPLLHTKTDGQSDDIPQEISVVEPGTNRERDLDMVAEATGMPIYDPEVDQWR